MADKTNYIIGLLTLVILIGGAIYISLPGENVRMRIDEDKTTFYIYNNRWLISGVEYNKLFDGTKLEYRDAKNIEINTTTDDDKVRITRKTPYKNGAEIIDTYLFEGNITGKENFPVYHTIEIINATNLIYQYEVRRLDYNGSTIKDIKSPQYFGKNMKISFDDGYYYSKIYKYVGVNEGKLTVKYRIEDDYVKLENKLYDPIVSEESDKYNVSFEFSKMGIVHKCMDITIKNLQDSPDTLDLKTIINETNFDADKIKNIKFEELKTKEVVKEDYEVFCTPYNETNENGTIEKETCSRIVTGNHTEKVKKWEYKKLISESSDGIEDIKNKWETTPIQPAEKEDDTSKFRICFDTPIVKTGSGFGSSGTIYLDVNNETFVDKTHSSWWDEDWTKTKLISNISCLVCYLNITYQTGMQPDFDDSRFVDQTNTTEYGYVRESYVDSEWANFRVLTDGADPIRIFYDNDGVSTTSDIEDVYGNLSLAMFMDEGAGTNVVDYAGYDDNGTKQGNADWNSSGQVGSAMHFDGSGDYINVSDSSRLDMVSQISISAWIWLDELDDYQYILEKGASSSTGANYIYRVEDTNYFTFEFYNTSWQTHTDTTTLLWDDRKIHTVLTYDEVVNNIVMLYVNGTNVKNFTRNVIMIPNAKSLNIGSKVDAGVGYGLAGWIDELLIRQGLFNQTEVNRMYNTSAPLFVIGEEESESIAPVVTLNSPINAYNTSSDSIIFNCTASDNSNLVNVSLYGNWTGTWHLNETNSSGLNNTAYIFSKTISEGNHKWNCLACDYSGNCNFSASNRTFTIDITNPLIEFISPTEDNDTNLSQDWIQINVSITETNFKNVTFYLYNTSLVNSTTYTDSTRGINFTSLSDGSYYYNVTTYDWAGNSNFTETRKITLDAIMPIVTLNSPVDTYNSSSASVTFNCTSYDNINLSNVSLYGNWSGGWHLNETNITGINNSNYVFSKSVSDGQYIWNCYACDWLNNCNFSEANRTFNVDTGPPLIDYELAYPNASILRREWIFINVSVTEANEKNITFNLVNGTDTVNSTTYETSERVINWTGLPDTNYTYNVTACDWSGGCNSTETRLVYLDNNYPLIEFLANSDASNETGNFTDKDWVYAHVNVTEANERDITFEIYTILGIYNNVTYTTAVRSINWTNLPNNTMYFWNVTVCDRDNKCNSTESRWYGIERINMTFEGYERNITAELGSNITIEANNTFDTICVDIDHPEYGTNYSCGDKTTIFEMVINYFRKTFFSDGSSSKTLNLNHTGFNDSTINFTGHQYDEVQGFSLNISGENYPQNITFYNINTTDIGRFFYGYLIGGSVYVNDTSTGLGAVNLTYATIRDRTIYFYVDDNADLTNFTINISGTGYGIDYSVNYTDFFNNWADIDTSLTTAKLDRSGFIFPRNLTSLVIMYDDFDGAIDQDKWDNATNFSDYVVYYETNDFIGENMTYLGFGDFGGRYADIQSDSITKLNLLTSDAMNFNVEAFYSGEEFYGAPPYYQAELQGYTKVILGNYVIWTSLIPDAPGNVEGWASETSVSYVNFSVAKYNGLLWQVNISGYEVAFFDDQPEACISQTMTYNWTNGSWYLDKSGGCSDSSGELVNSFYTLVNPLAAPAIAVRIAGYKYYYAVNFQLGARLYELNTTKWNFTNSTVVSKSIYNSSSDIESATMTVSGYNASGEDWVYYLSADNGVNWEEVYSTIEHNFTNTGRYLKWRIDTNIPAADYLNITSFVTQIDISTPQGYPNDITFDFGNDNITDYTINGEIDESNGTIVVDLSSADLSGAFTGDADIGDHTYLVPLEIYPGGVGQINLESFNLTYNPNPVVLNYTYLQNFFDTYGLNETNFSILVSSYPGNITIDDIRYDYAGGNSTIDVLTHNSDYSLNISRNVTYYYSNWNYNFPLLIEYLEFIPKTPTAKNVTPHGQTPSKPILNITNYGYGGMESNFSVYLNETYPCVNLTAGITNNKSEGALLNVSWIDYITNFKYLESQGIWMWADYNCNFTTWKLWEPDLSLRCCCESCDVCSEDV